jgi:uncharacterized repeat protein (TIGR03803 family)
MSDSVQYRGGISGMNLRRATLLMVVGALGLGMVTSQWTQAQVFTVLYNFQGPPDGALPRGALIRDAAGNLYGTTFRGGTGACYTGCGTLFKVAPASGWTETVLYDSLEVDAYPQAAVVRDPAGNLFGTTSGGGDGGCFPYGGCGTIFEVDPTGKGSVLHSFGSGIDGATPLAGLIRDPAGNFYGTTAYGGTLGFGTVFKFSRTGKETVLYSFKPLHDSARPEASLVRDRAGNLYGTASTGGAHYLGTVFRVSRSGKETVLYSFKPSPDGNSPMTGLVLDATGNLYGVTESGGVVDGCPSGGCGTIFKLDKSGKETQLYRFGGGSDGNGPSGLLTRDKKGNLYGTSGGGSFGFGTVFKLDRSGRHTVLHSFNQADGIGPNGALVSDGAGSFYGTTDAGGAFGLGTVFKVTP